jgi:hypothetical protein
MDTNQDKGRGEDGSNKTNIMFIFGSILDNLKNFCIQVQDLGKSLGIKSEILLPNINLINDPESFYDYYFNSLNTHLNKNKIIIIAVQHEISIIDFLNKIISMFGNINTFTNIFNILNISYAVNYNTFIKNKHKDLFSHLYNIVSDELVNFILIDEGYLSTEKIERTNKIISSKNSKEVRKIFENQATNMKKTIQFYKELYFNNDEFKNICEEKFFKLKFRVKREIIEEFINRNLNFPLKYNITHAGVKKKNINDQSNSEESEYMNMSDQDFQNELADMVKEVKCKGKEPVIEKIVGYVKYVHSEEEKNDQLYQVIASHKEKKIEKDDKIADDEIGLLICGRNILNNSDYIDQVLITLSGEIPQFKPHRTKQDLSEEEVFNLNLVNFFRDIPEGWWWDGPVILDEEGNRYGQHPRILYIFNLFRFGYFHRGVLGHLQCRRR